MAFRSLVSIGNYQFPEPSAYTANTATAVDAARNAEYVNIGAVVRDDIAKADMTWNFLTVEQWSDINKLFKKSRGGKFSNDVTFFDQTEGTWITRNMYVSDRNGGIPKCDPETGIPIGWQGCRLALVEN